MTIKQCVTLKCDAKGCYKNSLLLKDDSDQEIKGARYFTDPKSGLHYCRRCTPKAKRELGIKDTA